MCHGAAEKNKKNKIKSSSATTKTKEQDAQNEYRQWPYAITVPQITVHVAERMTIRR